MSRKSATDLLLEGTWKGITFEDVLSAAVQTKPVYEIGDLHDNIELTFLNSDGGTQTRKLEDLSEVELKAIVKLYNRFLKDNKFDSSQISLDTLEAVLVDKNDNGIINVGRTKNKDKLIRMLTSKFIGISKDDRLAQKSYNEMKEKLGFNIDYKDMSLSMKRTASYLFKKARRNRLIGAKQTKDDNSDNVVKTIWEIAYKSDYKYELSNNGERAVLNIAKSFEEFKDEMLKQGIIDSDFEWDSETDPSKETLKKLAGMSGLDFD